MSLASRALLVSERACLLRLGVLANESPTGVGRTANPLSAQGREVGVTPEMLVGPAEQVSRGGSRALSTTHRAAGLRLNQSRLSRGCFAREAVVVSPSRERRSMAASGHDPLRPDGRWRRRHRRDRDPLLLDAWSGGGARGPLCSATGSAAGSVGKPRPGERTSALRGSDSPGRRCPSSSAATLWFGLVVAVAQPAKPAVTVGAAHRRC